MDNRIIIDWLEYTHLTALTIDGALEVLSLPILQPMPLPRGAYGYKSQYMDYLTGLKVLADGQKGMGVHVIISGSSCRALESLSVDLIELIQLLDNDNYNITRIDIALDIYNSDYLMCNIVQAHKAQLYKSKWRSSKVIESTKQGKTATTIYYGSRSSAIMLRIYDKSIESGTDYSWVRLELEIKKEYAKRIAQRLKSQRLGDVYVGIVNNYIEYLQYRDSNVTRSKSAQWWRKVIDDSRKISLYQAPEIKSYQQIKKWLIDNISASLVTVLQAETDSDVIHEMIVQGQKKLKQKHQQIIRRGQLENEQCLFSG